MAALLAQAWREQWSAAHWVQRLRKDVLEQGSDEIAAQVLDAARLSRLQFLVSLFCFSVVALLTSTCDESIMTFSTFIGQKRNSCHFFFNVNYNHSVKFETFNIYSKKLNFAGLLLEQCSLGSQRAIAYLKHAVQTEACIIALSWR